MGYNKGVSYGNYLELVEYEYDLEHHGREKEKRSKYKYSETKEEKEAKEVARRKDNGNRAKARFAKLVSANLDSRAEPPLLVTLTYKENMCDLRQGYYDFRLFIQKLRIKYGKKFKYIAVPEFQSRGAVHFHVLFWYFDIDCTKLPGYWGLGIVFTRPTDGNDKLSSYLAKYMSKAFNSLGLKNKRLTLLLAMF